MRKFYDSDVARVITLASNPVNALEEVVCGNLERCSSTIMKGCCSKCPWMRRALTRGVAHGAPEEPQKPKTLGGIHVVYNHHGRKEVK